MKGIYQCQVCGKVFIRELHTPIDKSTDIIFERTGYVLEEGYTNSIYLKQTTHECNKTHDGIIGIAELIGFVPDDCKGGGKYPM